MPYAGNDILDLGNEKILYVMKKHLEILFELGKVRITAFVSFSTLAGYILFSESLTWNMLLPTFGVFLLACGASALNHYQERKTDALMERTKSRPLPSGRISELYALTAVAAFLLCGSAIIYLSSNFTALVIGIITVIWYNVIYTPLKKKYALAVVPGSIIGALPPMIGYTAAGGSPFDLQIIGLALFFFIWQIPHFWLLLLIFGNDYDKAGFPTLTKIFDNLQLSRITFMWIIALAISSLFILSFDVSSTLISFIAIILMGVWLISSSVKILNHYLEKIVFRKAFININVYVLAVVLIISFEKLFLKVI